MKLFSALYRDFYPFKEMGLFDEYKLVTFPQDIDSNDAALVVWGGGDISPALYGKPASRRTGADDKPSRRDALEWALMKEARERDIPIIGVCRGAQMLCALAGGFLVQDVTNHAGHSHGIETKDGRSYLVNSLHHQMMFPFHVQHELIAWSVANPSDHYIDVDEHGNDVEINIPCEPEFVYFPKEKGIAIQWHPEYMKFDLPAQAYVKEQLERLL